MLFIIEILPYDKKYSDTRNEIYWNRQLYSNYKEVCYIKQGYVCYIKQGYVFDNKINALPGDYILTNDYISILLRNK